MYLYQGGHVDSTNKTPLKASSREIKEEKSKCKWISINDLYNDLHYRKATLKIKKITN